MSSEYSVLALRQDFEEALTTDDAARWELVASGPLEILARVSSKSAPDEVFEARLAWQRYPDDPPSLKFRNSADGRLDDPTAWPVAKGFRPKHLDACVNWCAEGFGHHPKWKEDPKLCWDRRGNVLLKVLRLLQEKLDDDFQGRFRG